MTRHLHELFRNQAALATDPATNQLGIATSSSSVRWWRRQRTIAATRGPRWTSSFWSR